jgi:hypothetical protein
MKLMNLESVLTSKKLCFTVALTPKSVKCENRRGLLEKPFEEEFKSLGLLEKVAGTGQCRMAP